VSTSSRLLVLLSLLQTPRAWSGSELAERLEVSRRTVRRDVDRLRDLGYPVEGTIGVEGGYRLAAGTQMPPLLLDDDEAVAIAIGLRTVALNALAGIDESSIRALAKLEQVMPPRLRSRFAALAAATGSLSWGEPGVDPELLTTIARAIGSGDQLRFRYRAADNEESRRDVEPKGLVAMNRRWYLVAWDVDRADWRTFRVYRIEDPWTTRSRGPRHELPDGLDPVAFVERQTLAAAPTYRAVATVALSSGEVRRRMGEAAVEIEPLGDDLCRITTAEDTLPWLAFRLVLLEADFEIQDPPEMQLYLHDLGDRFVRCAAMHARK
jgi:predicted DNA-binding transcriptional regulator YafY